MRLKDIVDKVVEKKLFILIILLLYLLPLFIQVSFDEEFHLEEVYIGLPGVLSGDEPHYLVVTTSLINDHDIYVENNYDNAYYNAGCDVGYHFRNQSRIRRHMLMYSAEKKNTCSYK